MKKTLKRLYRSLPFKQSVFSGLRLLPLPTSVYQHLHFEGVIRVRLGKGRSFLMRHHGYMIENELFWRGIQGWEKVSLELWTRLCRRSDTIFDVGANTGVYALLAQALRPEATIIAVEPVERVFLKLEENIGLNGKGVIAIRAAVTDQEGEVTLYDTPAREHVLSVSLNKEFMRNDPLLQATTVPARTIAGIAAEHRLERIDLMKIDVETHEPEVLAGFREILLRDKPSLLIEILNDEVAKRVEEQIKDVGYLYYNIDDVTWPPPRVATLTRSGHFNFLLCQPEVARSIGLV
ncbi:MAG: FkbM family methyltransferase [Flavobacteriales bacterium]|nr:FkbM family methyltransferase [Flavobacteriales bacterium]